MIPFAIKLNHTEQSGVCLAPYASPFQLDLKPIYQLGNDFNLENFSRYFHFIERSEKEAKYSRK